MFKRRKNKSENNTENNSSNNSTVFEDNNNSRSPMKITKEAVEPKITEIEDPGFQEEQEVIQISENEEVVEPLFVINTSSTGISSDSLFESISSGNGQESIADKYVNENDFVDPELQRIQELRQEKEDPLLIQTETQEIHEFETPDEVKEVPEESPLQEIKIEEVDERPSLTYEDLIITAMDNYKNSIAGKEQNHVSPIAVLLSKEVSYKPKEVEVPQEKEEDLVVKVLSIEDTEKEPEEIVNGTDEDAQKESVEEITTNNTVPEEHKEDAVETAVQEVAAEIEQPVVEEKPASEPDPDPEPETKEVKKTVNEKPKQNGRGSRRRGPKPKNKSGQTGVENMGDAESKLLKLLAKELVGSAKEHGVSAKGFEYKDIQFVWEKIEDLIEENM